MMILPQDERPHISLGVRDIGDLGSGSSFDQMSKTELFLRPGDGSGCGAPARERKLWLGFVAHLVSKPVYTG